MYQVVPPSVVRTTPVSVKAQPLLTSSITRFWMDGAATTGRGGTVEVAVAGTAVEVFVAAGTVGGEAVSVATGHSRGLAGATVLQATTASRIASPPSRILNWRGMHKGLLCGMKIRFTYRIVSLPREARQGEGGAPYHNENSTGKVPGAEELFPDAFEEFELLDGLEAPAALVLVVRV